MVGVLLFGPVVFPAQAAFTSLYIFGDTVSTTTDGPGDASYYLKSYSNGRVWVEVLAQQQGLTYYSNKNLSYFDHNSALLLTEVNSFPTPTNATNALFVVWVNDADFVDDIANCEPYTSNNIAAWNNAINQSLANHFKVITNLYFAKSVRTLIMPNAVDITKIPGYTYLSSAEKNFIRLRVIAFNTAFTNTLNRARTNCPAIKIYVPDMFALLDNVITNAAYYGLTNALDNGQSIDARTDPALSNKALNGPGANYIFWDYLDPTAKLHSVIADITQQLISPVRISQLTAFNGSNRLDMANVPIGQNGLVIGRTNLVLGNWTTNATFVSSNATQTVYIPASGSPWFYRLKFPYSWTWP
jgi:phospholipase/lecithinase/hemolysin